MKQHKVFLSALALLTAALTIVSAIAPFSLTAAAADKLIDEVYVTGFVVPCAGEGSPSGEDLRALPGYEMGVTARWEKKGGGNFTVFEEGKEYRAILCVSFVAEGCRFPSDLSGFGAISINGVPCGAPFEWDYLDIDASYLSGGNLYLVTKYFTIQPGGTQICDVNVNGLAYPRTGETVTALEDLSVPSGAHYSPNAILWFKGEAPSTDVQDLDAVFSDGAVYYAAIEITPDAGYRFRGRETAGIGTYFDSVTINGKNRSVDAQMSHVLPDGGLLIVTKPFTATNKIIVDELRILRFSGQPVVGEDADGSPPEITLAAGSPFTVTGRYWKNDLTGERYSGAFQETFLYHGYELPITYVPCFTLRLTDGTCAFAETLTYYYPDGRESTLYHPGSTIEVSGPGVGIAGSYSGTVGSCTWEYNGGSKVFSVSGSGTFVYDESYSAYLAEAETVIVGNGVSGVGDGVLNGSPNVRTVSLADSVQSVGSASFSYCPSLTDLTLSQGLVNVGVCSFTGIQIAGLSLPSTLRTVGEGSFAALTALRTLTVAYGLRSVGNNAFSGAASLTEVRLPRSVTSIGTKCFGYDGDLPIDGFTIRGYSFTEAQSYALRSGITFVPVNGQQENRYYAVGEEYPFAGLNADAAFEMTKQSDGRMKRSFFSSEYDYSVDMLILEKDAVTLEETLHGQNGTDRPVTLTFYDVGWFDVYYDPSTGAITVEGDNVSASLPAVLPGALYAVGNGSGKYLGGAFWAADDEGNKMNRLTDTYYDITYYHVAPGTYELMFIFDGSWANGWFGCDGDNIGEGGFDDAVWQGSSIRFTVSRTSTLSVSLDLYDYDAETHEGAFFSVFVRPDPVDGDADGNGVFDIGDVTALLDMLSSGDFGDVPADPNGDGVTDIKDVSTLLDMLAGAH